MPIGKPNGLANLKPQIYANLRQVASDGCGFLIVKTQLDKYAAVAQELSGEVLLSDGTEKHNAAQCEQTSCGKGPSTGSRATEVVAAHDDGTGVTRLEQLNVTNEFCDVAVGFDTMDANHLHRSGDVPG